MSTPTLRKGRMMTPAKVQTNDELIAELNAKLRARDPMQIMKQQIRLKTLNEVRERVSERRLTDETHADAYDHVDAIIKDLEYPVLT
jgi:hypothetical protein